MREDCLCVHISVVSAASVLVQLETTSVLEIDSLLDILVARLQP